MIKFGLNQNKAMQTILWLLNKKPGINKYNLMKVMFSADEYHINNFGRPIYGEKYYALAYGTVPSFMKDLLEIEQNVPFFHDGNKFYTNAAANEDVFSETDLEALEYGLTEYADLSFSAVKKKNHANPAWKKHEKELKNGNCKRVEIPYEDIITNPTILADLTEMGELTENMVF